jgi:hypothetical protein
MPDEDMGKDEDVGKYVGEDVGKYVGEDVGDDVGGELTPEKRRLAEETANERYVWWYLAYFLFGIHIVAFVLIYAVMHRK